PSGVLPLNTCTCDTVTLSDIVPDSVTRPLLVMWSPSTPVSVNDTVVKLIAGDVGSTCAVCVVVALLRLPASSVPVSLTCFFVPSPALPARLPFSLPDPLPTNPSGVLPLNTCTCDTVTLSDTAPDSVTKPLLVMWSPSTPVSVNDTVAKLIAD